jgi:hypothetical protein
VIRALPQQRNRVIVSSASRNQQFTGVNWNGTPTRPIFALVRTQSGERPLGAEGYDLLGHEGRQAAYGDKKLFRHAIDSGIDQANELLFPGMVPTMGAGLLAIWLVRKSGEQLTFKDTLKIKELILTQPELLGGWCEVENDLFNPENRSYRVFAEPDPAVLKRIVKAATQS